MHLFGKAVDSTNLQLNYFIETGKNLPTDLARQILFDFRQIRFQKLPEGLKELRLFDENDFVVLNSLIASNAVDCLYHIIYDYF